ncbi:MAG: Gfo/Idh/MocA family protein [Anaerovoracaceae bacterium]
MKRIKVGSVGLGRLGYEHARNLATKISGAELVAVCSPIMEERERAKTDWGIENTYSDFKEMINNADLDAVAIVSPSPNHVEHIEAALDKGLHVFVEKPLGVTVKECEYIEKKINQHPNQVFFIGFMRRYDASYAEAKRLIKEGKIGKPFLIKATSCDPESTIEGAIKFGATSGGIFIDFIIHDVDLARWYLEDEVDEVYAVGDAFVHKEFKDYNDADNACAMMKFKNGGIAMFHCGRNAAHGYQVEAEIVGPLGTLRVGEAQYNSMCTIYDNNGVVHPVPQNFQERFEQAYITEMQEFIDCIIEGRKPDVNVKDGVKSLEVAIAATEAFKEGKIVKL